MTKITELEYNELICIDADDTVGGERIDVALSAVLSDYSRSFVQKLFEKKLVYCNGKGVSKSTKLKAGDEISFLVPEPEEIRLVPQNIELDVRYEDNDLLIVNKPKGMVVHPAPGNYDGTLVNALLYHCEGQLSGINGVIRPGIVHRIDKDTSGLLVVAKTDLAHRGLSEQIKEHSVDREYRAVVHGRFNEKEGVVDAPIGRSQKDRKKMCVTPVNSKNAVTHYRVLQEFRSYSFIACVLETGRTHQIRVHMSYLSHPVAGDMVYGPKDQNKELNGQCLHAGILGFIHPVTGEKIRVEAELPQYFNDFIGKIS